MGGRSCKRVRAAWQPGATVALLVAGTTVAAVTVAIAGCSTPQPRPTPRPTPVAARHQMVDPLTVREPDDGMKVSGDILGSLDQQAIQDGVNGRLADAGQCFQRSLRRQPYLAGSMTLEFRVALDGTVKRLRLVESTLGAYGVERCVLGAMQGTAFSRPRGGEAEFTYPLSFEGRVAAQVWDAEMVHEAMTASRGLLLGAEQPAVQRKKKKRGRRGRQVDRRRRASPGPVPPATVELVPPDGLVLTFYVDGGGRVVSAGMVADEPVDDDFAERFISNLKRVVFDKTSSTHRYAKVTYRW